MNWTSGDRGAHGLGAVGEDGDVDALGHGGAELREEGLHPVGHLDDVGAGLALHVEDDGALRTRPAGELRVLHAVDHVGHVVEPDGGAVLVGDDQGVEVGGAFELVVGGQGIVLARAVDVALGLVDVGGHERAAHVFEGEAGAGQGHGIDAHAHGRFLATVEADQADARDLRDLLRQH